MTNEQHIENLKKLKSFHNGSYGADIDRAIKALEQTCEDVISRQAVLDNLSELNAISFYEAQEDSKETYYEIRKAIKQLPSVNPQPKTGHWIVHEIENTLKWLECSNCHCETSYNVMHNYCPNCGAKMFEPQERSNKE